MGEAACDLLTAEVALDRVEAELASELPPHLRAFARAHADGNPPPPAPPALQHAGSLASVRAALAYPLLTDRALGLLRLLAPVAIESTPEVAAARAATPMTWDAYARLAAARERASRARFGMAAVELAHQLHGSASEPSPELPLPEPLAGWRDADATSPLGVVDVSRAWDALRRRHGVTGAVRFHVTRSARPRTVVVTPRAEAAVVIPERIATPADRFAVAHELGHVLAAFVLADGIPRVVDEAAAAYTARVALETEGGGTWHCPLAAGARARRLTYARALDRIERGLPTARPARVPWSLWHDPGAQAAYVAAEAMADRLIEQLGLDPAPGALAEALAAERARVDREIRF
jgi:hypothetical protein